MSAATCWRGRHLNAPRCKSTETETRASEDVGRGARMLLWLVYNSKRCILERLLNVTKVGRNFGCRRLCERET